MRRLTAFFLVLLFAAAARAAEVKPALGVLLVVDQMRYDYPARSSEYGVGRFLKGAYYDNAIHAHIPTYTAVGHTALSTGRHPKDHGIVGNEFFDRKESKSVYCVDHDEHGKAPHWLSVPTLGDRLKEKSPKSKVVSISAKDRAAILMAGKKADVALWYNKKTGRFETSSFYGALPDWVRAWNDANEVEKDRRKSIRETTDIDRLTLSLAQKAVEVLGLGADEDSDLLFVSLSATDYLGHAVGPFDPLMDGHLKSLDREIGSFLDFLDEKVGGRYTAGLSSDHGVLPLPGSPEGDKIRARRISSKGVRSDLEAALEKEFGEAPGGKGWIIGWHPPHAYLNVSSLDDRARKKLIRRASALLSKRKDFVWAYPADSIPKWARFSEFYRNSVPKGRAGDLVYLLEYGALITDYPKGTSHSSPYDYDARVPLAMIGVGVRPGRYSRTALTVEFAPTMGRLLGIPFEGEFLMEMFEDREFLGDR
jgi:predicted AlkP superfamily pyrophosphatase or phosphodiesterase